MSLAAQISALNRDGLAALTEAFPAEFVLRGQTVMLPFGARLSQREMERHGYREEVTAMVIVPAAAGVAIAEGDVLRLVATREEFRVKQVFAPTNASGVKAGLQRIERRA